MSAIDDWQDARRSFREWRKKHPDRITDSHELFQFRKDPLKLKRFLESQGFHFNLTDAEFVEDHRRLNLSWWARFRLSVQDSVKSYHILSRKQKGRLLLCLMLFSYGLIFIVAAGIFLGQVSPSFLKQARDYSDPKTLKSTLDLVYTLVVISFLSGFFAFAAMCWTVGNVMYSYYLEARIVVLEKGVKQVGSELIKTQDTE